MAIKPTQSFAAAKVVKNQRKKISLYLFKIINL